jgi:Intracellular septation protein A
MSEKPQINPFLKIALDLGPLVLFFIANGKLGIFGATACSWSRPYWRWSSAMR